MFQIIGDRIIAAFTGFIEFISFSIETFFKIILFSKQTNVSSLVLLRQILFTGYEALALVLVIATSLGGLIIIQLGPLLQSFGQNHVLYSILVMGITRELACVLTAFLIVARSGTAISTELGNMKVNQEIELIDSIGISPISYLVVPRMVGVTVACVVLSIYFNLAAFLGGWWVASFVRPIPFSEFSNMLLKTLSIQDIIQSIIKSLVFGILISLISAYQGLKVDKAITEVPQRTIKAVVYCISTIIITDISITLVFFIL
ncbi:MAG: ABC transporter permease [Candidatus Cloacimonetes bacterium]|jgi:phospholipid/cholesterol/gamma-HCH transport system permease protein|nr:ABC transporter permease [Candidatus Cloacimonadota bacterium]HPM01616.1 ABC transporter permease [Candidatus Cloacimonadota bacterium]